MRSRVLIVLLSILVLISTGCSAAKNHEKAPVGDNGYTEDNENIVNRDNNIEDSVKKLIKNGYLILETDDVAKTYANILTFVSNNEGYEYSHQMTVNERYTSIKAVLKIKPDKLDDIMSYVGDVAVIINSSTDSEDITDKYYDAQTRITTKKKMLENYYNYLEDAKNIDETLSLQKIIDGITEEIEVLEGKLKLWDTLSSEATLTITISQINDPLKPKKDINWNALTWSGMGTLIKNGFISVSNVIVSVFQWFIIFITSISPVLVIGAIIILIIKRKSVFKKKNRKGSNDNNDEK